MPWRRCQSRHGLPATVVLRSSLLLHREAEVAALREQSVTLLQAEARQREQELRAGQAQVRHPVQQKSAPAAQHQRGPAPRTAEPDVELKHAVC